VAPDQVYVPSGVRDAAAAASAKAAADEAFRTARYGDAHTKYSESLAADDTNARWVRPHLEMNGYSFGLVRVSQLRVAVGAREPHSLCGTVRQCALVGCGVRRRTTRSLVVLTCGPRLQLCIGAAVCGRTAQPQATSLTTSSTRCKTRSPRGNSTQRAETPLCRLRFLVVLCC
jgi:hypothetical protein